MKKHGMYEGERSRVVWPLAFIVGLVPLIVRMRNMPVPKGAQALWADSEGYYADFFSANKLILLGILTILALILFFMEDYKKLKFNNKPVYICLGLYLAFASLSTIFAKEGQKFVALFGIPGRYEGLIALIIYIIIMLLGIYIAKDWWNIKTLHKGLSIGALIMGIIGLSQFLGHDILQTDGGKALILPYQYLGQAEQLNFTFASRVYGTVFNPNYVGSYTAMLMPLSVVAMLYSFLYSNEIGKKISASIFVALMALLWFASYSRGGLLGGVFALIFILIFLAKDFIKSKKHAGIFAAVIIVGIVILNVILKGSITGQIKSLKQEIGKLFSSDRQLVVRLEDIILDEDGIEILSNIPSFRIEKDGDDLILIDDSGNIIEATLNEKNNLVPEDERYKAMYIEYASANEFRVHIKDPKTESWFNVYFVYVGDSIPEESFRVVVAGQAYKIEHVESWGFKGKEKLGSGRGYIWSRTFPMIKDTWLIGYGPDTYSLIFPHHDIIGKINSYTDVNTVVDKPHNLYLQTIVSTGLPSLLALIALFVIYTILWVRHMKEVERDDIRRWMSVAIYAAVSGYLIAGFFNDSVISVAPIFWVLWGVGIGLASNSNKPRLIKK